MGTLTLGTGSVLKGDAATTLRPDTLAGALDTLTLDGATLVLPEAQVAARGVRTPPPTSAPMLVGARVPRARPASKPSPCPRASARSVLTGRRARTGRAAAR